MFQALARLACGRPRSVVVVAAVVVAVAAVFGTSVARHLKAYDASDPQTESARTDALLKRAGVNSGVDVVALVRAPAGVTSPSGRRAVARVAARLRTDPAVGRVVTFAQAGPALVSHDGRSTYAAASLRPGADANAAAQRLLNGVGRERNVSLGGAAVASYEANHQITHDLRRAELLAFPLLFALSFVFFRGALAALLPLLVGAMAIVLTLAALRIAAAVGSISVFSLNAVTGLGLGLAIDYSLFMLTRYRQELARDGDHAAAVTRMLVTTGRSVLFSSLTVAAALGSLLVFPQQFLYSMGIGGMIVSAIAGVTALLVLPAVLVLLGSRADALAPRRFRLPTAAAGDSDTGAWYRLSRGIMRRPGRVAVASAVVMLALAAPLAGVRFTQIDAGVLPRATSARQVDDLLERDFDIRRTTPVTLVARTQPGGALRSYVTRVRRVPGVLEVGRPRLGAGLTLVDVTLRADALSGAAQRTLAAIRALAPPFTVLARGQTAAFVDSQRSMGRHLPVALLLIAATTFLLLFAMTGSVLLPIKAVVMNLLTLAAALGALVAIFQGALATSLMIFLAAVAFGLSTDYGVFLLARIKEARDGGLSNADAVAVGLQRTGRLVTAAATLFGVAIGAFASSPIVFIKELGVGTALAVLLDATVVRALLVPALMQLLGERNWWAPRPLVALHDRLRLTDTAAA